MRIPLRRSLGSLALGTIVIALASVPIVRSVAATEKPATSAAGSQTSDKSPAPPQAKPLLIRGATLWTMGKPGIVAKGDLLVENGKIAKVGGTISAPKDAVVIDGTGKHVTPGIIDCHSHTAIEGDVNEATHNITAEVRIRDVIDREDVNIYRQLAGGVTTTNALHGSANSIGGQNAVVRFKWKRPVSEMLFAQAPQGIKFALGENPKQSNWGEGLDRYPKSRMGVEQSIRGAFLAAKDNHAAWERERAFLGKKDERHVPPRKDLQLDALNEILDGKRFVHSHSYRADEILALIRVTESFGFHVRTFQHVLEGYKVADEMAATGAGGSTFSDWWGYKYEVNDAIPYNAALMTHRGVVVSMNSDSDELARRLNLEGAKGMKYGGLSAEEALALVTINPAKQLAIDTWVGSLEAGKDGDLVIWSGDPLSVYSVAESTWIEGIKYFDRAEDLAGRSALETERAALIAKIKNPPTKDKDAAKPGDAEGAKSASTDTVQAATPVTEAQVGPTLGAARPAAPPSEGPVTAFVGGTIHTVSGEEIVDGVVLVRGGKIAAVGRGITVPPDARRVDLAGRHLYPSMIDANTSVGLVEIGSVKGTVDTTETGRINPNIHTEVAVNPSSEAIPVARVNGVLLTLAVPSGSYLRGTSALMRMDGWTWEEMTVKAPVAMHFTWPNVVIPTNGSEAKKSSDDIDKEKDEALKDLKTVVEDARAYLKAKNAAKDGKATTPEVDTRLEAMIPVLERKTPFVVDANSVAQIRDAIAWAEKEKIALVISGGRDAWRVVELLAKKHVPVILGATLALPAREDEPYDTPYTTASKLQAAGVPFAISTGGGTMYVRNLPYQAGMSAAFGLPKNEALRGVTLYPARILGVDDRLGSIEPGKDATFFVTDGDPLEIRTQVLAIYIDGTERSLDTRQKRLYEQYKGRPAARAGAAANPLGDR